MEDRVKLRVFGLSYNQLQSGAFALLLAQVDGPYRIPIVIGQAEAQAIAVKMEAFTPSRPLTADLFVCFAHAFGVKLKEVFIYKFENGVFSSELTFTDGERQVVLDARTSDAIAIAMRTQAPIYTTHAILHETGFIIEDDPTISPRNKTAGEQDDTGIDKREDEDALREPRIENYAVEELERTLEKLIKEENYEEAARVSEILKRKKGSA